MRSAALRTSGCDRGFAVACLAELRVRYRTRNGDRERRPTPQLEAAIARAEAPSEPGGRSADSLGRPAAGAGRYHFAAALKAGEANGTQRPPPASTCTVAADERYESGVESAGVAAIRACRFEHAQEAS